MKKTLRSEQNGDDNGANGSHNPGHSELQCHLFFSSTFATHFQIFYFLLPVMVVDNQSIAGFGNGCGMAVDSKQGDDSTSYGGPGSQAVSIGLCGSGGGIFGKHGDL